MKRKKLHLELLRIFACFSVIFVHMGQNSYSLFSSYPTHSAQYWLYMVPSIFFKCTVHMFFAISGSLLIDREESLADLFKRRILKIAEILLIFSLLYYLVSLDSLRDFSAYNFFGTMYTYTWNFSFWYLYSFLAFLICLPFIRALAKNLKDIHFYYLFGIVLVFDSILPIVEYLLWKGEHSHYSAFNLSWLTTTMFVYPCLGYFIEKRLDITKMKKWLLPLWAANIAGILICCFMTFFNAKVMGRSSEAYFSSFILINVATLFISAKYFYSTRKREHKVMDRIVTTVGGCTMGIYLVNDLFLIHFPVADRLCSLLSTDWAINPMLTAFIACFAVFTISFIVTLIMKKIPLLNRLL